MRLALMGMAHETNTFSRVPASYAEFQQAGILRGDEMVREYRDSEHVIAGYLEASDLFGCDVVPLVHAATGPIGTITKDAFDRIAGEMLELLTHNGPWDGVLLTQHGAAVSEEYPDADGEIAARVRSLVGPDVPIGLTPDLHGNFSRKMIDNSTVTVAYRTNPHLDTRQRAVECAGLVVRTFNREFLPVQALEMPPLVCNIVKQFTGEEPMLGVIRDVEQAIARPGILSASASAGVSVRRRCRDGHGLPGHKRRRLRGCPQRRALDGEARVGQATGVRGRHSVGHRGPPGCRRIAGRARGVDGRGRQHRRRQLRRLHRPAG